MKMDPEFLAILACPICKGSLQHQPEKQRFVCRGEQLAFPIQDGIPVLLAEEATPLTEKDDT